MNDLRSAKTSIKVLDADPNNEESLGRIDYYLTTVEAFLVNTGQERIGPEYVDRRLKQLNEARMEKSDAEKNDTRFIQRAPRHRKWIRVTPTSEISAASLKAAAAQMKLIYEIQKDGSFFVSGDEHLIKDFVKNIASKYKSESAKYRKKVHNG